MSICEKSASLSPELEAKIFAPYTYFVRQCRNLQCYNPHMGTKFAHAFNYWLNIPQDKLEIICSVYEYRKNACLLLDDIQDSSSLRGGLPVAHRIYGIPLTINAANSGFFLAIEKLLDGFPAESRAAGVRILTEEWLQMHRGQGLEMVWRETLTCPTEEQYLDMIWRKKSSFIAMTVRLMQLFSEDKRDFGYLSRLMGMAVQIGNDYNNLKSKEYEEGKGFADDLTEGSFSFPIIHAIRKSPDDQALINILKQQTENVDLKKFAVSRLEESGSLAYTQKMMSQLREKMLDEVDKLGGNPKLLGLFEFVKEQAY